VSDAVRRGQRFTEERPCPICKGWDRIPRGKGLRCSGYLGTDGRYAHCSREEFAGNGLELENGGTYAHRMEGPCRCGATHGEAPTPVIPIDTRRDRDGGEQFRPVKHWDYEGGLRVVRAEAPDGRKAYYQLHKNGQGYAKGRGDAPLTLYLAPEVRAADPRQFIFLVEGEKCVDALVARGLVATTTPGGADQFGKAAELVTGILRGRHVVIIPDNDDPGRKYASAARDCLVKVCASVRVLELPGLEAKEDVYDWLARGGDVEDLVKMAEARPDLVVRLPVAKLAILALWSKPLPPAIPTGISGLDKIIGGLRAESFVILNAPPGRGKTGMGCQVARATCRVRPTLLVSSELSERQTLARVAAQVLRVPWLRLFEAPPERGSAIAEALDGLPLFVVRPRRGMPMLDLLNRATDDIGQVPALVFDYLQHAARRLGGGKEPRFAVGNLIDEIGTWITDNRTTGLVISSVARGQYRHDDDATAEDTFGAGKETGDIEFDASAELFLQAALPPEGGSAPAKLHVSKNRFGSSGQTVGLRFHGAIGCFEDDPRAAITELEDLCYKAIAAGARTQDAVREAVEAGKPRVVAALRSLSTQGFIDGPPYRILGSLP
jgi:hypothetical protein